MPRRKRCKLLLDEMLPARDRLPRTNHYHDLKHIVHDYHLAGLEDSQLVKIAFKEKRVVVTNNVRHFKTLCRQSGVGLIGVNQLMKLDSLDKNLLASLRIWTDKYGYRFVKID